MRNQLIVSLLFFILCLGASNQAPWQFLLILSTLTVLLPLLLTTWIVPGGFAWHKYEGTNAAIAPGPIGWPFFGFLAAKGPLAHRKLAALSKAHHASELMAFSLGATPVVISSQPETAREILHGPAFSDRPTKLAARSLMFERAIGFAPSGVYWRHLRRIAAANMFSPRSINALSSLRQKVIDDMLNGVSKEMQERGFVVLKGVLQKGSLDNIVGSVFGRSIGDVEMENLAVMVSEGYELIAKFNWGDYFPFGGLFDFYGLGKKCKNLAFRVRCLVGKIVEERRKQGDIYIGDDFLSVLLSLPKDESLSDLDILAVLWEMIFRGTDVVAILLEWIMARMVLHPDIQAKAQQELDTVVGNRPVEDTDIPKLPYLQAIVKEALRMHPPGPLLSWARLAIHDVYVGKYFIPAGTTAMVNMWAITHDESIWKDPWTFRPERFIEENVNVLGSDLRLSPFGSGRRVCPGRALGLSTVYVWLASFLQHYKWSSNQTVCLSECLRLSLEMKKPLVCRVDQRNQLTGS